MTPRRGEVWLADFGEPVGREQAGRRPALVVSSDGLNAGPAGVIMVIPITTTRRDLASHVEIDQQGSGLDQVSYVKCEDLKSISTARLIHRLGEVDTAAMLSTGTVLRYLLAL